MESQESKNETQNICTTLKIHPITYIAQYDKNIEANIQEEDTIGYVQLMDKIDIITGEADLSNESFLTQLKKNGIIERKTAFFDPFGYFSA